jgi:PKD domain/Bacterial Ig domain
MKTRFYAAMLLALPLALSAATNQILAWNNLGMHCMDSDYSVFSILPPYNTIEAQLIVGGKLVTNGSGYTVTYQAVADPTGSINTTSVGKGNYATYVQTLYGATVTADQGLAGWNMPGSGNKPQTMLFEQTNQPAAGVLTPVNWWRAEGIPLSPYDDAHNKNTYPMMRLIAKNSSGVALATNDIVLPVSDEMDCRACHASGSMAAAKPAAGWVWSGIQERDFRLNIVRLHDEKVFASNAVLYAAALAARGFNPQGLYRGVVADNHPVLCAACHASEALGAPSYGTIPPLTASIHSFHAHVMDPLTGITLDSSANRSACYRCHPGSTTKCLRGAMGGAIAADGSMEMQCQSCHGNMSTVGSSKRVGWFMEPNCASCHTGTATSNNGQIRYTSVFTDTNYTVRVPTNSIFSTQSNTPAGGLSLYRFSAGHGGLQCEACHGSTHAEFPSIHPNDNIRDIEIQGHAGVMVECSSCHTTTPTNYVGGPHGMHPVGSAWVSAHPNYADSHGATQCQACHGTDYRGTVLSRMQADRTLSAFGTKTFFRGALVGCYTCHQGPSNDNSNTNAAPTVSLVSGSTANNAPLNLTVTNNPTTATLRIISQPANGSLGVSNNVLTYFPNPGFVGSDTFTYAAWDGSKNSLLATGTVSVTQGVYSMGLVANVPTNSPSGWPVAFAAVATITNYSGSVVFNWNFGDGSTSTNEFPTHTFATAGNYNWSVMATAGSTSASANGNISVSAPVNLSLAPAVSGGSGQLSISVPSGSAYAVLEESSTLGAGAQWTVVTNLPVVNGNVMNIPVMPAGSKFYRVRQAW